MNQQHYHLHRRKSLQHHQQQVHLSNQLLLKLYGFDKIKKVNDIKGSQSFKAQGVSITFSGKLIYDEILISPKKENVSFLVLDQIEDPQNFGQIIRTVE